jgi:hypothetical protein
MTHARQRRRSKRRPRQKSRSAPRAQHQASQRDAHGPPPTRGNYVAKNVLSRQKSLRQNKALVALPKTARQASTYVAKNVILRQKSRDIIRREQVAHLNNSPSLPRDRRRVIRQSVYPAARLGACSSLIVAADFDQNVVRVDASRRQARNIVGCQVTARRKHSRASSARPCSKSCLPAQYQRIASAL